MNEIRGIRLGGKWTPEELRELVGAMAPLPKLWVEGNPHFRSIIRRPVLTNAPPEAPGHSKYEPDDGSIVVFDKGVYHGSGIDPEQFRRSVYHELAHSIVRCIPDLIDRWAASTAKDGFVDEYAKTSPEEDFADTLSEFLIHPEQTQKRVPRKAVFLKRLIVSSNGSQEKRAMANFESFTDELTKTAAGGLKGMLGKLVGSRGARVGLGLAGAGGLGAAGGHRLGEESGREETMEKVRPAVRRIAMQQRMLGRREGAMATHHAIMRRLRGRAGAQAQPQKRGK